MARTAIQSSPGLLRWPALMAARPGEAGATPKFGATFVALGAGPNKGADDAFLAAVMQQMDAVCFEKWNLGIEAMRQRCAQASKSFNLALKRNSDPKRVQHAGIGQNPAGFHFEAKTQYPVDLFDQTGTRLNQQGQLPPAFAAEMFHDGAYVFVWVSAYAYDHPKSGPGIGLNLNGVQFIQKGLHLGGAVVDAKPVDQSTIAGLPPPPVGNPAPQGDQVPPAYGTPAYGTPAYGTPGAPPAPAPDAPAPDASYYPPAGGAAQTTTGAPSTAPNPAPGGFGF